MTITLYKVLVFMKKYMRIMDSHSISDNPGMCSRCVLIQEEGCK